MTSLKLAVISKPYQISELISQDIRTVDTACDWLIREFKQITTAAVTEKVWGEYVSLVCQILSLAKRNTKMKETSTKEFTISFI